MIAFFLAPPLKVRLRGGAGRAAQCASRRTRTRRAMMMGCDGERLPRQSSAQQFVRLWQSKLVIGDRAGLRLRGETGLRPRAARAARGCMGSLRCDR